MAQSGVFGLLRFLVIAAIVFAALSRGLPWLKEQFGDGGATTHDRGLSPAARCIADFSQARDHFAEHSHRFVQPRPNVPENDAVLNMVEDGLDAAKRSCRCSGEACDKGAQATEEFIELIYELRRGFSRNRPPLNAASKLQDIDYLIDQARRLARQGG